MTNGTGTATATDYSLKRWEALIRYLDDGAVPIDNNWAENQIRPWALDRSNRLFAGSLPNRSVLPCKDDAFILPLLLFVSNRIASGLVTGSHHDLL